MGSAIHCLRKPPRLTGPDHAASRTRLLRGESSSFVTQPSIDIVAMGDAIVDVIASCDEAFLDEHNLPRGSMQLLTPEAADALYGAMGQAREMSGSLG
jgi:hypothetical protein